MFGLPRKRHFQGLVNRNSGEGFCEVFTMHLFAQTCKKSLQHSILS